MNPLSLLRAVGTTQVLVPFGRCDPLGAPLPRTEVTRAFDPHSVIPSAVRRRPSLALAYGLWLPLGLLGAHRFYLGRWGTGVAMACVTAATLVLLLFFVGLLTGWLAVGWWLVDGVRLPAIVRAVEAAR